MNQYVTGNVIKKLREEKKMTQQQLAKLLNVSDKTISKWETCKGYPDITLIEPLSKALNISIIELLSGQNIVNKNRIANMKQTKFYVCPFCGNVITSVGEALISCCGITLPALEAEEEMFHEIKIETVENEYYVTINHEMSKKHYISFIASIFDDGIEIQKLYPEQKAEARIKKQTRYLYYYCNLHGLMQINVKKILKENS
ncbi:MAG: helix-turn-helix domain-containing protein [Traorella sp.]